MTTWYLQTIFRPSPETGEKCVDQAIADHREIHFRLLRHDLISEICLSVQQLKEIGGIRGIHGVTINEVCSIKEIWYILKRLTGFFFFLSSETSF